MKSRGIHLLIFLLSGIIVGVGLGPYIHEGSIKFGEAPEKADAIASKKREREPDRYEKIILTTFYPTGHAKSIIFADSADWYSNKGYVDLVNPIIHEFDEDGKMIRRVRSTTGRAFLTQEHDVERVRMRGKFRMESWKENKEK
ncbi:MAG: hypothetical protein DRN14_00060 [Thermoplasmata archaeon]|nr:MAG: hypothetical protein DRN14_00060 [Thermoplasmata archaeon]